MRMCIIAAASARQHRRSKEDTALGSRREHYSEGAFWCWARSEGIMDFIMIHGAHTSIGACGCPER